MSAISVILMFLNQAAFAGSITLPASEIEKIVIKGTEAQVQLVPAAGPSLKIDGIEETSAVGTYSVVRKGNTVEIRMNEASDKAGLSESIKKGLNSKSPKIEISGGAVPVEIQVRQGVVNSSKWTKDIKVSMVQGRVLLQQGAGSVSANVQKGSVQIFDYNGRVQVDSYDGQIQLRNLQGDGSVRLFTGLLQGEKLKGFWTLHTQQAQVKLQEVQGTIQFENGKGSFDVQSLVGRLEGQNQDGSLSAKLALDSELDVRSKSGRVQVQLAPGSGAALNLKSEEGQISVPNELTVTRLGTERVVRGRVRGDAQRGRVFVRAEDAAISVK